MKIKFTQRLFLIIVISCFYVTYASAQHKEVDIQLTATKLTSIALDAKIDSIIKILTLEEKIAMTHAQSKFSTKGVARLGIPEIWMSDGPHGVREEISWDSWSHAEWTNLSN